MKNIDYKLAGVIPVTINYEILEADETVGAVACVHVLSVEYNGKAFEPDEAGLTYEYLADYVAQRIDL